MDVLWIVMLLIDVLNVLLHSTGIYLLWKIYVWKEITTQQLVLFHLSIAEGLLSTLFVVFDVLVLTSNGEYGLYVTHVEEILLVVIYLIMIFMTVDRLMAVVLSWKYKIHWRVGRTKKLLAVIWLLGIMMGVCFNLLDELLPPDLRSVFIDVYYYLQIVFSLIFVAIAVLTYVIIYWKDKMSGRFLQKHATPNENDQQQSTRQQSKLRFRIPGLIILSYLICNTIPSIMIILWFVHSLSYELVKVMFLLFRLGYTSDPFIYIFLQAKVRNQLLGCCKRQSRSERSNNAETNV